MFVKKTSFRWTDMDLWNSLLGLFDAFKHADKELYLVGGCVRDLLLGKTPKDYDLCTNATPEEVKALLSKQSYYDQELGQRCEIYHFVDTGLQHGTITVLDTCYHRSFEITTYRIDGRYSDGRHPDKVTFTPSLEEDLKRRDFTINSFAYNLSTEELLALDESFFYDLQFKIVRTVGDAAERYEEDALRMLRALRFAAQLSFSLETYTYRALSMCAPLLQHISKERVRDELTKILLSDNPQCLEFVTTTGLEPYMFEGLMPITAMVNCDHDNPWHYATVFHHTVDVIRGVPKTFELRWAALFHDIGKPQVKALKEGTTNHYRYIGHPEVSAEIALKLMDILKFSNEQKDLIHKFVLYHDYPLSDVSNKKFKQKLVEIGEDHFLDFLLLRQADALAHRLAVSTEFAIDAVDVCKQRFLDYLKHPEPLRLRDLAINGDDLKSLGFEGKEIGDMLKDMLDKVLAQPSLNTKPTLLQYAQSVKDRQREGEADE